MMQLTFKMLLCILAFCLIIIYNATKKLYQYRDLKQHLPVVYGLPFVGILYKFMQDHKFLYAIGSYFHQLNSWTYLAWFANVPLIITTDPDIIKHICNSDTCLNKARVIYGVMDAAMPNGIITSKYFKWRRNRKLMNPSFAPHTVQQFVPEFNRCSKKISLYFRELSDDEKEHAIFTYLKQEILQMAVGTTMGPVLAASENVKTHMAENFNSLLGRLVTGIKLSFLKVAFLIRTPSYYKSIDYLKGYVRTLINRKLDKKLETDSVYFLDRAIKYQEQNIFEMDDTITETYTMIIGSFETVSTTLYSLIIMLAMHPEVQQRLYEEVAQTIGETENINARHLDRMTYLNMVVDETLRLMPPIPIIGREALESFPLTEQIKLPRDFQILISIFHLHRRPDLWGPSAEQFDPNNFLPENIEKRHPYAFIPFSKGARNCVGWRYAYIAVKLLIVNLIKDFEFSTGFSYHKLYFVNQLSIRLLEEPKIRITTRKAVLNSVLKPIRDS